MTQTQLGKKLGVSQQRVSYLLKADNIKVHTLEKIGEVLGVAVKIEIDCEQIVARCKKKRKACIFRNTKFCKKFGKKEFFCSYGMPEIPFKLVKEPACCEEWIHPKGIKIKPAITIKQYPTRSAVKRMMESLKLIETFKLKGRDV
jgi:transcriptional regulator with XRE-family HTH domain